jgi:hypothetical protein
MAARSKAGGTIVGLLATVLMVSPALAGDFSPSGASCSAQVYEQPFLPWLDPATYVLAPGGTFEPGVPGWQLSGGAMVANGNEPFYVHGGGERFSLSLPAGSSATSNPMCVTLDHPTIRFFAKNPAYTSSTLKAEVLFRDILGQLQAVEFARLVSTSTWAPTVPLAFLANVTPPLTAAGSVSVAFRFTPVGDPSGWRVDDVYVDPYASR